MSVKPVPGGFRVNRRDKYGARRKRIFKTEAEAITYDEKIKRQRRKKGIPHEAPPVLTVGEFLQVQIDKYSELIEREQARIGTMKNLVSLLNTMPSWLKGTILPKLTRAKCRRYLKELQMAPSRTVGSDRDGTAHLLDPNTCRGKFKTFRAQLERAVTDDLMHSNPARDIELPARKKQTHVVTEEDALAFSELKTLLQAMALGLPDKLYVLFSVMAMTGMRGGEARSLIRDDIELDFRDAETDEPLPRIWIRRTEVQGILGPPKTGGTRSVDVSPQLKEILEWWLAQLPSDPNVWLFEDAQIPDPGCKRHARILKKWNGLPLSYGTLLDAWYSILDDPHVGITRHLTPHCLRHTYATLLLNENEELTYVSAQLGHATTKETQETYAKWIHPNTTGARDHFADELELWDVPWDSQTSMPWSFSEVDQSESENRGTHASKRHARPSPPPAALPEPLIQQALPLTVD